MKKFQSMAELKEFFQIEEYPQDFRETSQKRAKRGKTVRKRMKRHKK